MLLIKIDDDNKSGNNMSNNKQMRMKTLLKQNDKIIQTIMKTHEIINRQFDRNSKKRKKIQDRLENKSRYT